MNLKDIWTLSKDKLPPDIESDWCIYKITNLITNEVYVGQTSYFYGRFVTAGFNHLSSYKDYLEDGGNTYLYNAINKYGEENFDVQIIDTVKEDIEDKRSELNRLEKYWINELHSCVYDKLCNGYNMTFGGEDAINLHNVVVIQTRLINKININLNYLKSKGIDITPRNYITEGNFSSYRYAYNHIDLVTTRMYDNPPITSHSKWTEEMNSLFKWFDSQQDWDTIEHLLGISKSHSQLINNIISRFKYLKDNNYEINAYNYLFNSSECTCLSHVENVLSQFDVEYPINNDVRWTPEMETLFRWYYDQDDIISSTSNLIDQQIE